MPVPPKWSGQDKRFGETVKNNLDVLCGYSGDPLDRAITARDLLDSGIVRLASGSTFFSGSSSGLAPATGVANYDFPPAPTNLTASGAFQNILLTWNVGLYEGHSHSEVFRHTSDSIADATLIGQVSGFSGVFSDSVGGGQTYFYWVRSINQSGIVGPFNSSEGTEGETSTDVAVLLDILTGEITSSELASSIADPIATIPTLDGRIDDLDSYTGYGDDYEGDSLLDRIDATETATSTAASAAATANTAVTTLSSAVSSTNASVSSSLSSLNTSVSNLQTSLSDLTSGTTSVYVQDDAPTGTISTFSRWYDTDNNMAPYVRIDANGDGTETWESLLDPRIGDNESAITDLNTEVFAADGTSLLATSSALNTLDSTVLGIYTPADNSVDPAVPASGILASVASDVTSLNSEVFAADGGSLLATGTSVSNLTTDVRSIYTAEDDTVDPVVPASGILASVQSDVTTLNGEVFAEDGSSLLATGSAVTGLTTDVRDIYTAADGDTAASGILASVQSDVTSLNGEVFAADGTSLLATGSALSGLTTDVRDIYTEADGDEPASGILASVQSDVTTLNGEVFAADGSSLLATGTAVSGLTTDVRNIYTAADDSVDPEIPASGILASVQSDVTSLKGVVFDEDGESQLATGESVTSLTNNVNAIYDADGGVDDDGNAIPSGVVATAQAAITSLNGAVFDDDGNIQIATGAAITAVDNKVLAIYDPDDATAVTQVSSIQTSLTSLNGAVFDENDAVKLATSSALGGLQQDVSNIYVPADDTVNPPTAATGVLSVVQSDVVSLEGAVFNDEGGVKLASGDALSTLTNSVTSIYVPADDTVDPPVAASGVLASVQSDVTSLKGVVFNDDGESQLALGSSLSTLTNDVNAIYDADGGDAGDDGSATPSGILASAQASITSLEGAVFDENDAVKLATGSALQGLTSSVEAIYDADGGLDDDDNPVPTGLVVTAQQDITSLKGAVFNDAGGVKLATGTAVSTLTNSVKNIYDPDGELDDDGNPVLDEDGNKIPTGLLVSSQEDITLLKGEVFDSEGVIKLAQADAFNELKSEVIGTGNVSASRIDGLYTALYDDDGALFASASALEELDTAVTGEGGIASKVSNIAASMFADGDTTTSSLLATSENLDKVTTEVFPNGASEASRISQLSSALYKDGDPDEGVKLASADFVSNINTAIFGDGTTQTAEANKIDTLQVAVTGTDGTGGISASIQEVQEIVGDSESGLQSQYSIKIDNNNHIAGFGLSNTANDDGSPTSAFIIRADKFAIVNPDAADEASNEPSNNTNVLMPFAVQGEDELDDDGNVAVPAGVYMDGAFIKNGTITTAQIKEATIDTAKITGQLSANRIGPVGKIDTSLLNIDGSIIRSEVINGVSTLTLGNVSANKIKAGTLDCDEFTVENLRAKNITGDVNDLTPFEMASATAINAPSGAEQTLFTGFIPEQADDVEKRPYISAEGWGVFENDDVYRIELWMRNNVPASGVVQLGTAVSGSTFWSSNFGIVTFAGDKTSIVQAGAELSANGYAKGVVTGSFYQSFDETTYVYYEIATNATVIVAGDSVQSGGSIPTYQMVNSFFFRAPQDYHPYQFSISGGLAARTSYSIDFEIRIGVYNTHKYYVPYSQPSKNWTYDKIYALKGIAMSLR
jgi:phage tail protein X